METHPYYALPTFHEPFGLTALQAAFSGCASGLSRIDTLQEVRGDALLYAPPDAPERGLAQLRRLIDEPAWSRLTQRTRC